MLIYIYIYKKYPAYKKLGVDASDNLFLIPVVFSYSTVMQESRYMVLVATNSSDMPLFLPIEEIYVLLLHSP